MKKFLPTANSRGFTLIELMVVVVIIAILSIVGISLYATVQKNVRDGVRRAEVNSLGKSIESSRDPLAATYKYTGGTAGDSYETDYPQNKPKDPFKDGAKPLYCIATSTAASPLPVPNPQTWVITSVCPSDTGVGYTAWEKLIDETGAWITTLLDSGVKYWRICARLEVPSFPTTGSNPFCVVSNL